ncbi:hypothetical protein [Photobacterium kishitanii]|uniref:Uncharacterized protein n=1 Tax=Photobacterium kishitanii TaxID=318456 RepID=A0A2T3KMA5_9GAMM|nr:hypothetical protein [Photobacterium kishitanii]PSV00914.1 hypothetical protein C9J27_02485 [Photobacterium kishitanii]
MTKQRQSITLRDVSNYNQTAFEYFTGVGSQKTPVKFKSLMAAITYCCSKIGIMLRSGGAKGADLFFESGIPQSDYEYSEIIHTDQNMSKRSYRTFKIKDSLAKMEAMDFIQKNSIHENWENIINNSGAIFSVGAHIRNIFQVVGLNIFTPKLSKFLICYTPDGASTLETVSESTGGTRTAIRTAITHGIPVFNLANKEHLTRIHAWVSRFEDCPIKVPPLISYF